jgi:RecA-family ATPase
VIEHHNIEASAIKTLSAEQIMKMELSPQRHLIGGILTDGCNLLAGKPKIGKSWLALQFAICISMGRPLFDKIPIMKKGVLYLALEDNLRRIRERLSLSLHGSEPPSNLYFETECPRASAGGLSFVEQFLQTKPDVGLVIIDTLARFREPPRSNKSTYHEDYQAITGLKSIADRQQITILIIHHLRKMENTEDPLDNISGTTGLSGATDTNIVLNRNRKNYNATMFIEGRDVERQEIDLMFDPQTASWGITTFIEQLNPERRVIVELLQKVKAENKTMSPKEIADATGKTGESVRQLLLKMTNSGEVMYVARGAYTIPDNNDHNGHIGNNDNNCLLPL